MTTTVFVYTMSRQGEVGAWSRYVFPFDVDAFCQMGDHLYIRAGDDMLKVDETADQDFDGDERAQPFDGVVQWPWLDCGAPGVQKTMAGFDVSSMRAAEVTIEIGYDQSDTARFTAPYTVPGDTIPGTFFAMPVMAASFSPRLTFSSYGFWQFQGLNLYFNDNRVTS